jgi:hypothetical protein
MTLRRLGPILFLAWLLIDFVDPSLPGVFYFEGQQLFMDGAVATSCATPALKVAQAHQSPRARRADDREIVATGPQPNRSNVALRRSPQRRSDRHAQTYVSDLSSGSPDPH